MGNGESSYMKSLERQAYANYQRECFEQALANSYDSDDDSDDDYDDYDAYDYESDSDDDD
jgi:hypothetical protein